ncbi:hypothetical protein Fmac_017378 [Flemingia macrophylla]|uniref:Protein kinase domain-containing protein n=1 Tax=Flemingia macrophylla TaxID=520843 RepID=A0ABD1M1Y1_9FABA
MFLRCFGHTNSFDSGRGYPTVIEELCRPISLSDLKKATDNFHPDRIIHRGYRKTVYKGYLPQNDSSDYAVAVKLTEVEKWEEFKTEIEMLCQLRHPNIISLVGFCDHKEYKIIVQEHMSNGCLLRHLQGGELSWKKRLEICIGAARGLHYLHAGAKRTIIHRHIRSSNIVLDENMHPKLTNFGPSVLGARFMSKPKPVQVEYVRGPKGYAAPEYLRDVTVTDKCDVFSFGMVLLEIVWEKKNFCLAKERQYMEKFIEENIDRNIKGKIAPKCWQVFMDITERCIQFEPDKRPAMGEVEVELEYALWLQEQADISNTDGDYILLKPLLTKTQREDIMKAIVLAA